MSADRLSWLLVRALQTYVEPDESTWEEDEQEEDWEVMWRFPAYSAERVLTVERESPFSGSENELMRLREVLIQPDVCPTDNLKHTPTPTLQRRTHI